MFRQLRVSLIVISFSLVTGMIFQSCGYSKATTREIYENIKDSVYDVIIVPGMPLQNGQFGRLLKARLDWSKYLFDKGIAKNVMYSGSAVYTPFYEAKVMAIYAKEIGIPEKHIYGETKAEHSTENLYYSYMLAKKLGFKKIALATDPYQAKQLAVFAKRKMKRDIDIIPVDFEKLEHMNVYPVRNLEISQAKAEDFTSITERQNFFQRMKGTLGMSIDKDAYQ
jgi:vancomycin permeability regulator SanA